MNQPFSRRALLAAASLLACATPFASAQSLDLIPAYHPDGPVDAGGRRIEFHSGDLVRIEAAHPGLTHEQSQAVKFNYYTLLFLAVKQLANPVPLGPTSTLYLSPGTIFYQYKLPFNLELEAPLKLPPSIPSIDIQVQVAMFDLVNPGLQLYTSPGYTIGILPKRPELDDRMVPLGSELGGTESVTFDATNNRYLLRHELGGVVTEYVLNLDDPDFSKGTLRMEETTSGLRVLDDGGVRYVQGAGAAVFSPAQFQAFGTHTLTAHGIDGQTAWFDWRDELPKVGGGTVVRNRRHEFTLEGRSVRVDVFAVNPSKEAPDNYFGFNIGGFAKTAGGGFTSIDKLRIPYMDQIGVSHLDGQWFHSAYTDLFRSNAGFHTSAMLGVTPSGGRFSEVMNYPRNDDFTTNPLSESNWVTVSRDVNDVFVKSTAPPSPNGEQLKGKVGITLGIENKSSGAYLADFQNINRMKLWMFDEIFMFKFHWMNQGTNRRAPTHSPPNPDGGAESTFQQIISTATNAGWKFALYTDFFSLDQAQAFDDNPNYSENPASPIFLEAGLKDQNGNFRKGYNISEDISVPQSPLYNTRVMAPRRAVVQLERESAYMVDVVGTNASYFDVMTISAPDLIATAQGLNIGGAISQEAASPSDRTIGHAINSYKSLFRTGSLRTGGPVVGEGSFGTFESRFDSMYAGYLDATYRTLSTKGQDGMISYAAENAPVIVDYELRVNHNRMWGFGMGQYARFFDPSGGVQIPLPDQALDKLRAVQISYGHNGYFLTSSTPLDSLDFLTRAQRAKEYYTMQSLSAEWASGDLVDVAYRTASAGTPWLDLTTALNAGTFDFQHPVLRIRWSNGLDVYVNHGTQNVTELGFTIPPTGWVAVNPTTGYENLNIINPATGTRVQRVRCADYEMADGNGVPYNAGGAIGTTTNLTVENFIHGKTLTEAPDGNISVQ